ncbi:hypothetical protein JVU11DRAFT_9896 [Chiua virens]|nr:hypothetical protein JVU11DRAFT_9896 [Chiua virens]
MSTTTQILFNSPALHSLKRDQLVKLCKIHSLKASGKNKDLIQRLKLHAETLPSNDPLNIAVRSEDSDAKPVTDSEDDVSDHSAGVNTSINTISRPSEQWEVVMDTITEVDEETLRSNRGGSDRQVGEFGTTTSKGSVTSSLRAIATSLGLKRNTSKSSGTTSSSSSLSSQEVTQSSSTLPTSDPNGGPEEPGIEPIPGQSNLQGLPAPSAARLSLSQAPATTTIRLVSNPTTNPDALLSPPKLQPFATSFDLVPDTPGNPGTSKVSVWPLSPSGTARESLYPSVPSFQGFGDLLKCRPVQSPRYDNSDMDIDLDIPGRLAVPSIREPTPEKANISACFNTGAIPKSTEKPSAEPVDIFSPAPKPHNTSARSRSGIPRSEPFVFGSPLPQNNKSNLQFRTAAQSVLDEMNKRLAGEGVDALNVSVLNNRRTTTEESTGREESNGPPRVAVMFEKIHQKEFDKMDSITSHYAAKRGARSTAPQPILSKKRKSSLVVKERQSGVPTARHRSNGCRVASGASEKMLPGAFDEEGDEDDEVADRRMSKRPRVELEESDAPAQPERSSIAPPSDPEEEARKQKEREAIRRRLDHNKAKRRSSMGRPSVGRAPLPKAKPPRLGLFATAKSLVQNVWNRGAGSKAPSNVPAPKPAQLKGGTNAPPKFTEGKKTAVVPGSSGAPPLGSQTKRIPSGGSNTSLQSNAPSRSTLTQPTGGTAAVSRIWKSPTPSLNPPSSSVAANPKPSTIAGHGQSNNRNSSLVGFSSLGSRTGPSTNNAGSSSLGAKSDIRTSAANLQKPTTTMPRLRTLSTLMAPTASSLAKTSTHSRIPVSSEYSIRTKGSASSKLRLAVSPPRTITLEQITNSPPSPAYPAKVFSQPFIPPPSGPPMSLTAVATTIVGQTAKDKPSSKPPLPPKPKVLPGRKPRISRSRVIARLASQRAATGAGSSAGGGTETGTTKACGKVRSSMGAEVAGKAIRQSYAGTRGGDVMMSAKKRVRQSEHARRKSRVHFAEEEQGMDVD